MPNIRRRCAFVSLVGLCTSPCASLHAQCPNGSPPPCISATPHAVPTSNSIAVLYFDNLSLDTADAYLADGLTEETIVRLGQVERLAVKSRNAVQHFRGRATEDPVILGRLLGVAYLVSGSTRRSGNRVRVTVELVRTATGMRLWGDVFDRTNADLLEIEGDIADAVATAIAGQLAPAERAILAARPTRSPEAYDLYLRGLYFWNMRTLEGLDRALDVFDRATHLDSTFAPAYAGLANVYNHLGFFDVRAPKEVMPKARAAALRALALDSTLPEAHAAFAYVLMQYDWDWSAAEREIRRALELDPRYIEGHRRYAYWLVSQGREEEAIAEAERALTLDPLDHVSNIDLGRVLGMARRYDRKIAQGREMLARDSDDAWAHQLIGEAYMATGRPTEAVAEFRWAGDTSWANRAAGDRTFINQDIERLKRESWVPAFLIALDYAALGDNDRVLEWLETAYEQRDGNMMYLRIWPQFDSLRSDPRFARLQQRVHN